MSEVRATGASGATTRLTRLTAGPAAPVGSALAPPPADQSPAVNVSGALIGGRSRERIEGVVIGTDATGAAVLRTAAGDFRIETALPLAERSRLVLEIVHLTPVMTAKILIQDGRVLDPPPMARLGPLHAEEAAAAGLASAGPAAGAAERPRPAGARLRLAHEWPALDEVLQLLQARGAAAALIAALPGADDRLASAILFFVAALKAARLETWLGEDIGRALREADREELLAQLVSDFAAFADLAHGESPAAWQTLRIPLYLDAPPPGDAERSQDGRLVPLALFVRHSAEADGGIRFVFELPGTIFGPLQLDGLARTPPRLDLILRAHLPLPATLQASLAELVARSGDELGWPSRLIFETATQFPVNPLQDIGAGRSVSDLRV